jgi:hypothetical protein
VILDWCGDLVAATTGFALYWCHASGRIGLYPAPAEVALRFRFQPRCVRWIGLEWDSFRSAETLKIDNEKGLLQPLSLVSFEGCGRPFAKSLLIDDISTAGYWRAVSVRHHLSTAIDVGPRG